MFGKHSRWRGWPLLNQVKVWPKQASRPSLSNCPRKPTSVPERCCFPVGLFFLASALAARGLTITWALPLLCCFLSWHTWAEQLGPSSFHSNTSTALLTTGFHSAPCHPPNESWSPIALSCPDSLGFHFSQEGGIFFPLLRWKSLRRHSLEVQPGFDPEMNRTLSG